MVNIDNSLVGKLKSEVSLNEVDKNVNADTYNKYKEFIKEDGCKSNLAKFLYREFVALGIEQI